MDSVTYELIMLEDNFGQMKAKEHICRQSEISQNQVFHDLWV